jgi:hypothetical protein
MKPDIVNASISSIDNNPFRSTKKYPFVKAKIEALKKSIEAVGLWEGIIVRKRGNRYELAFGHHRVEAARQLGETRVPVIVRDLDDEQMLQFMGRENGEDYNSDFLCMLETWEAALKWSASAEAGNTQAIVVARLLGWTMAPGANRGGDTDKMNMTAAACNAAHALIKGGHITRSDLADMSVKAAREIVERSYARIKQIDAVAKQRQLTPAAANRAKAHVAAATKAVAYAQRSGKVAMKDLRGEVDRVTASRVGATKGKNSPLFAIFADALVSQINKMLMNDSAAEKLEQIVKALPNVTLDADQKALRKIDFALAEHEHETGAWRKKLARRGKVVPFLQLVKKEG